MIISPIITGPIVIIAPLIILSFLIKTYRNIMGRL